MLGTVDLSSDMTIRLLMKLVKLVIWKFSKSGNEVVFS